jgi:hypothetical protein
MAALQYEMGADVAPVTAAEKLRAESELRLMRGALRGWLKYRNINNAVSTGRAKAKVPPGLAKKMLDSSRDWALEQRLAKQLYVLLAEVWDAQLLPDPDVSKNPNAAVQLAEIAIAGRLPAESKTPGPEAQGLIWLWPAVAVVGLVLFTVVYKIRSDADLALEREKELSIRLGARTDYGFWLKVGSITLIAWLAWDKFGLREAAGRLGRKGAGG